MQKARSGFPERASLNMAPLTGIAFASNWLINKLMKNSLPVKTTRMTTNNVSYHPTNRKIDTGKTSKKYGQFLLTTTN
ncbi:hypothetical protein ACSJM2_07420 [Serratia marcescens]|uniref:hypothetical protein n=1 Tax=Serratia marcescens TaxID=615 RepID=UPI0038336862|nr:hypothetical protein [Serratia marcescens]